MNTLIVDDSSTMRKLILDALGHVGVVQADEAANGAEAVERCRGRRYDLILMDWNMPVLSGFDALKAIRKIGSKAAILMVTTESEKIRIVEALQNGADSYVIKPFQIPTFVERVRAVLKKLPPARASEGVAAELKPDENQERKMVDPKYLESVKDSIHDVLESFLGCTAQIKSVGLADSGKRPDHILAMVACSGDLNATIALSVPEETAVNMVNRVLGTEDAQVDETLFDALAELANILGGKCKAQLSEIVGSTLELSLPMVIHGNYTLYTPAKTLWTELAVDCDMGSFFVKVTTEAVGIMV